ncbi:putative DNA repair helicase [Sphingomonas sp. SKA58]|uniref:DEAD/DEAH box helicase family protein n=1 Tax=Sphingomonas sp. (strain SKA58) TaxID=314266 RepID=UPI0000D7BBB5|nr:DEAD/DEAH box helicase family protein [Sphingomonas sp. SKA58]EAT08809.1 putative DNA repair helicase [Sphingomonas sp. SKA58]
MLRDIAAKGVYKSDQDNILEDFYFPALSIASSYDRAVGFFSGSTLSYAAQALSTFITNGGNIRLILGAFADARDIEAVKRGEDLKALASRIGEQFLAEIEEAKDPLFTERFATLAWLVAHNRMEIKIALRAHGMYHDKIGIITDATGDAFVFAGSANESAHALLPTHNYESIDVFPTWKPELESYYQPHRESFERLWENRSRGTAVLDMPTAIREKLLEVSAALDVPPDPAREAAIARRLQAAAADENVSLRPIGPILPETINGYPFEIREHQRDALNAWAEKGAFVGVFDLATGAGKTITAVYGIVQMSKQVPGLTVVIAVPYQNLADQWCDILEQFNIHAVRCYVAKSQWSEDLIQTVQNIRLGAQSFAAIVVVNRTLKSPEFQSAIARIPDKQFLWIGDECHHHASEAYVGFLPGNAAYRIGLSATPEHYLDGDRNARLAAYYGQTVYTYTLAQAISDKVLTPYDYHPTIVELTPEEATDFIEVSDEIARLFAREALANKPSQGLKALLMKRARIVASAHNKIAALRSVLNGKRRQQHTLFYCGDGTVDLTADFDDDDDDDNDDLERGFAGRQIEVVSQILDQMGWRISRFTSREPRKERASILNSFKIGLIDGMVAIKCLDEGIDVPACSTAYILASARDPRQFIQRRGRILRRSPGKEVATIFDFIVVLPPGTHDGGGHARKLIQAELKRVAEFNTLARNSSNAYQVLRPVLQEYDLEHLV